MSTRFTVVCDCTWAGTYASEAKAAWSLRQHSCEKRARDLANAERGRQRRAAVDRTPKSCPHTHAHHDHGTYACYVLDFCRCPSCARANSTYEANRTRQQAYGRWDNYIDAAPARAHVRELQAAGLGGKRIAAMAGVSTGCMWKLIYGKTRPDGTREPSKRITKTVAARLLAVPMPSLDDLGGGVRVDGTGTRRRLEALMALGWSVKRLATDHGLDRQALDSALAWVPVCAFTARAVKAMYDAIGDNPAPETDRGERQAAARTRNRASAAGWVPPAEWDEADLDDPYAEAPARAVERKTTLGRESVDLDEWCHLVRGGIHPDDAARRCGVVIRSIETAAHRNEREDVLRLLRETRSAA